MPLDRREFDRRSYLKALGTSGAAVVLAGCLGGGGGGTTATPTEGATGTETSASTGTETSASTGTATGDAQQAQNCQPLDSSFTQALGDSDPTKFQFNPFNSKLLFGELFHYDLMTAYARTEEEYQNHLLESWSVDSETLTLTLRDQVWMERQGDLREGEWSELQSVTAEDLSLQFSMWDFLDNPVSNLFESWEVKDDKTLEVTRGGDGFSNMIFKQRALPNRIFTPRALWSDTVEELNGIDPESDEFSTVLGKQVLSRQIGPGEIVANGPWLFDTVEAKRRVVAKKNPQHPAADVINFPRRDWVKTGPGKQGMVNAMTQGNIDYVGDQKLTQSVQDTLQEGWQLTKQPALGGGGMYFNMDHEWYGQPEVRRAIRFAVSNVEIANNVNANPVSGTATGIINPTVRDNWLGSDFMNQMTNYEGKQRDKAAELMREAGLEKDDSGWWVTSSGDRLEAPIKTLGGWTAAVTQTQTMASQLQDFGIEATTVGIENSEFFESHWNPDEPSQIRDFSIIKYPLFGAFGIWHPYYYDFLYYVGQIAENQVNSTGEYEVPSEIGNPDSSTETINATELTDEMARTDDDARVEEITKKLAWTFNQNIPVFANTAGTNHVWYDTTDWQIPTVPQPENPPDNLLNFGNNGLIARGIMKAKCE